MRQETVLIVFILFPATLAVGESTCDDAAPHNCTFTSSLSCLWTFRESKWTHDNCDNFHCAVLGINSKNENMTSCMVCPTNGNAHCFQIHFKNKGNNSGLNVYIRVDGGNERQVWNSTGRGVDVWHTADIPISSNKPFQVIIEARTEHGLERLFIHYMRYTRSCQGEQTPIVSSSVETVSSTVELTTTTNLHTSNTFPTDTTTVTTEERRTTNSSNSSSTASTDKKAGSSDVGVAVGVVVAVIIIAVAVAIFILYRRKQLHLLKTCFREGNSKKTAEAVKCNRDDKRSRNTGTETPTASGYVNHAVKVSEPQSSHTYYNTIQDIERTEDSAAYQNSTIGESQSSKSKKLPQNTQPAEQDPYEIKAEDGTVPWKNSATRYANHNVKIQGKTGQYQNFPKPAANRGNTQSPSDYSMAQVVGDEATGVYHCLEEEDSYSKGEGGDTAVYHYAKDPGVNEAGNADAAGVYHILEEESSAHQPSSVYNVPKGSHEKASKEESGNYNTLDFAAKSCALKESEAASGGVYNHLNDGSDDPYNEVHREKRAEVIDAEYSHIK